MGRSDSASGIIYNVPGSPLQVVRVNLKKKSDLAVKAKENLYTLLDEIATDLPASQATKLFPLNFRRIDAGEEIFILKPSQRRHWTIAAAQNDAQRFMVDREKEAQS